MANPLLDRASPAELAERRQTIEKKEKVELFERLAEIIAGELAVLPPERRPDKWRQAPVAIRLAFDWADGRHQLAALEGRVATRIPAVCQRCLEPMQLPLELNMRLLLAGPDSPAQAAGGYESWEIDGTTVRPADIIEEALIMALPVTATHDSSDDCGPLVAWVTDDKTDDKDETVRPFADLRSQLQQKD